MSTAIRPLRAALISALRSAQTTAGARVYTPPVPQGGAFPRIVLDGYSEESDNFFGREGSRVSCIVKVQAQSHAGDAARESLWEEVHDALHQVPLPVTGHLFLSGTLRRTVTYLDPDGVTLHGVGTYEGVTRETRG